MVLQKQLEKQFKHIWMPRGANPTQGIFLSSKTIHFFDKHILQKAFGSVSSEIKISTLKIPIGFCQSSQAKIIHFKCLKLCTSQVIKLLHNGSSSIRLSIRLKLSGSFRWKMPGCREGLGRGWSRDQQQPQQGTATLCHCRRGDTGLGTREWHCWDSHSWGMGTELMGWGQPPMGDRESHPWVTGTPPQTTVTPPQVTVTPSYE